MTEQKALITGASDGIGRGMALAMTKRGVSVGLLARRSELLEKVAAECLQAGAPKAVWKSVDVTDRRAARAALDELDVELGGVDTLVLNAGIGSETSPVQDRGETALRCLEVNLLASVDAVEWAKPRFVKRARSQSARLRIAGVTSVAGARGFPGFAAYSASKAGLHNYLEGVRAELKPYGIDVVDIAPGFIDTAMTQSNRFVMPFLMGPEKAGN